MKRKMLIVIATLAVVLWAFGPVNTQSGGSYDLTWYTIDAGGGTSVGVGLPSPYTLVGTAGQPDAGLLTGGGYTLRDGF